ncbi:serine protease snake-like isoform X1 [Armigeres subalbatus]|uniref:serine protease snake-like isoform X1 n=1 Tax=Armigeres subalbatus TaxID=124917 RepID=UPI002ECFB3EF
MARFAATKRRRWSTTPTWMSPVVALIVLIIQMRPGSAVLKENDACRHSGEEGICRRYSACKDRLQNRITICSYTSQEAIVCCPEVRLTDNRYDPDDQRPVWGQQQPQSTSGNDRNVRIAVKKCNEYRKLSYNRVTLSALTLTPTVVTYEVPKCDNIVKLIVGGNITKPGEFPHMAAIGWRRGGITSFDCGGSLISDQYVLTAAHCYTEVDGELPSFVRLGDQNLFREDDGAKPKDMDIADFIRHPEFIRNQGLYNDIGLIRLARAVSFSNFIRPACLYDQVQVSADTAVATGFGLTDDHGERSDELLKVSLNIYDNQLCSRGYANSRQLRKGIMSSQLCVGNVGGGRDTCQGDSGGPLQITKQENHCVFYVIGITSFGQTCGSPVPAIYTRVASYLDWIESTVWE